MRCGKGAEGREREEGGWEGRGGRGVLGRTWEMTAQFAARGGPQANTGTDVNTVGREEGRTEQKTGGLE